MDIVFDEIMVGERNRAHDVLASTLPNDIARSLAHYLDLPGQLPPGFELRNYVSGFPYEDRYVVARTSRDPNAARQGMVFSHALVADLGAIGELVDIATVFERLRGSRPEEPLTSRMTVKASDGKTRPLPSPELCDMLATSSDFPAVIEDPLALEGVISALWPRLLPGMRREIRFRLSFWPEESDLAKVHIVAVPTVTVTRWPSARLVEPKHGSELPRTAAGRFLRSESRADLCAFFAELSIDRSTFKTFCLASRALEILKDEAEFEDSLTALRIIGSLQPDPDKGAGVKKSLLGRLANRPGPSNVQEFLKLRNLDLKPFPEKSAFLEKITERFNHLFETNSHADALSPIALSAFDLSQSTEDWRNACCAAFARLSAAGAHSVAPLVWIMLSEHPEVGRFLLKQIMGVATMDRAMAECMDEAMLSNNSDLSDALIGVGFVQAETETLINRHNDDLAEALKEACERDRNRYGDGAVERILELMEPQSLVTAALAIDDQIVMSAAAVAVASSPKLLAKLSFRKCRVQKVWIEALKRSSEAWRIRSNIDALRNEVFDSLLSGELASNLLEHLVSSPLGNILDYPRRADVWQALLDRNRSACLDSTAKAWTKSLPDRVSQAVYLEPEQELALALASPKMQQAMRTALKRLPFEEILNVFTGNAHLPDELFSEVFAIYYQSDRHPSREELNRTARLVVTRVWINLTRSLWDRYGMTDDLREFFHICADHLDPWDRLLHRISRLSASELDSLLVETACELYPLGPMDNEIWTQAGGNPSQLDTSGTGQEQWGSAIRKIRNGNQVRAESLIAAMRDNYPKNKKLNYLAEEYR
ncbi:MAG: hypothetical protein F4X32_01930 [Candidatus Dadabacteria bacterium]|nr:hypothetical protein [Candidatus Dadabacteria bacterium]